MLKTLKSGVAGIAVAAFTAQMALAGACAEDAMLVFDGSGSMAERTFSRTGDSRIDEAQHAVREVIPEVTRYRDVGLLIYGPGGHDACGGINIAFEPQSDSSAAIINAVDEVSPYGLTPLADSVHMAAMAMDYETKPAVIVVVTDGYETCGGAPCDLAQELSANSAGLQIHVVGFNLPDESIGWADSTNATAGGPPGARCLADATGGRYVPTQTVDELVEALNSTLGCMLLVNREEDLVVLPG